MRRWAFSFNQSGAVVLSLVEPITTVLIYPLVLDLYLASSLVKTCDMVYTVFIHLFLAVVTSASLYIMKFGMENICQLHSSFEGRMPSLCGTFVVCSLWNVLFTIYIMAVHQDWALTETYVPKQLSPPVKIEMVFTPGMKIFIPQLFLFLFVLVVATVVSVCRPTWKPSDKATLRKIWIYLMLSVILQAIYCISRLAFWYCSSTIYSRLSKSIDFTEWICYSKSVVFSLAIITIYYVQYIVKTELAKRGVISIMDYRPLFNNDH